MKIIQISAGMNIHEEAVWGLGEDGKVYLWDMKKGEWELWVK